MTGIGSSKLTLWPCPWTFWLHQHNDHWIPKGQFLDFAKCLASESILSGVMVMNVKSARIDTTNWPFEVTSLTLVWYISGSCNEPSSNVMRLYVWELWHLKIITSVIILKIIGNLQIRIRLFIILYIFFICLFIYLCNYLFIYLYKLNCPFLLRLYKTD